MPLISWPAFKKVGQSFQEVSQEKVLTITTVNGYPTPPSCPFQEILLCILVACKKSLNSWNWLRFLMKDINPRP